MPRLRLFVFVAVLTTGASASAQWLNYPTPGTPRMPDGKPNLTAPTPVTPDGKPDLSGLWEFVAEGARLHSGGIIPADLVVLATGYKGQDAFTLSMQEHNGGRNATLRVKVSVTIQ